jgi:hypothetical protein
MDHENYTKQYWIEKARSFVTELRDKHVYPGDDIFTSAFFYVEADLEYSIGQDGNQPSNTFAVSHSDLDDNFCLVAEYLGEWLAENNEKF